MKKLIIITTMALYAAIGAYGQVFMDFANAATGVNAPVTDDSGNKLSGNVYLADLFYAADPGGNPIGLNSMTDAGLAQPFQTGSASGYFADTTAVNLGISGQILFEVVVWQSAAGASWAQATGGGAGNAMTYIGNGGTQWGFSVPLLLNPNTFPSPPSPLAGLTSFSLQVVPEPATFTIGGLGAAALLLFRHGKKGRGWSLLNSRR